MAKPTTIDEYYSGLIGSTAELLNELRALSRHAAPGTSEALKWGHPATIHADGVILFVFGAHKNHANFSFTPSTLEAFAERWAGYTTGKGRIALPYGKPVPSELLEEMIAYRIREYEQDGVKWM